MMKIVLILTLALAMIPLCRAWPAFGVPEVRVSVQVGQATVAGVRAEDVQITLSNHDSWRDWSLTLAAPRLRYRDMRWRDTTGSLRLSGTDGQWQIARSQLTTQFAGTRWQADAHAVALSRLIAGEHDWPTGMTLTVRADNGAFAAEFGGLHGKAQMRLSGAQLSAWLAAAGLNQVTMQGTAIASLSLSRTAGQWRLAGEMALDGATWNRADGMMAVEQGQGSLTFSATGAGNNWAGDFAVSLDGGEALVSPLYFSLGDTPLALSGKWQLSKDQLRFSAVQFHEREAHGELDALLRWPSLAPVRLVVHHASGDADAIYRRYVRPFLADTLFADMTLAGTLFASLDWQQGNIRALSAVFHQVDVVDKQERFALYGLDGQLGHGALSRLRTRESMWRKLPLSGWQAEFVWDEAGVHLRAPLRVDILGGALVLERLEPVGTHDYRLDMRIEPVDLRALSQALDWPDFDGELSGEFQQVHFNRDGLRLQEPVFINIFGGRVAVRDLRVSQFFSGQPLLYFALDIDKLDLQRLTHVMRVAEIQGNISGVVQDVQIANGELKRFAADIHTSPDKPGKRSISHEAVQYLSQAGGGSAMVGGFVRVLNAFPYERLGVAARLENKVLQITGVEEAPDGGYYLVKGRGLPHLDIIGFERRVDWPELLRRLDAARHTDAAVVE